jgi:uncharacterized RDD family membrane protein YckC
MTEVSPPPRLPTFATTIHTAPPAAWLDEPGGFWRRLFAFLVDAAVVWGLLRVGRLVAALLAGRPFLAQAFYASWWLVVPAAYFVVLHGSGGQTLGKWLLGVRVVTAAGEPVGYARALGRHLGWLASAALAFIGHLVVPARADRRALYDHLAGTRVVRTRRQPLL